MKLFRILSFSLVIFLAPLISQTVQAQEVTETERINAWFETEYQEQLQFSPILLTFQGKKELYGQLDDVSIESEERQLKWMEASVEEMKDTFNYEQLDDIAKMSYDLWIYMYEAAKDAFEFTQSDYIFHQMAGLHTQIPNIVINFHSVDNASDMEDYISRLEAMDVFIHQLIDRSKAQAEDDFRPPLFTYEIVIKQSKALITGQPFDDSDALAPLWADANTKINTLQETEAIDAEQAEQFTSRVRVALQEHFEPAYQDLIDWLTEDMENAEPTPTGVSRHVNGEEYYNFQLRQNTTTDMTADEVHNTGLAEVERIHTEMEKIRDQVGFEGDLQEFFNFVNSNPDFVYPNNDEGAEMYLQAARDHLSEIESKLPDYFGILPKAGLIVKRVEAFREQDGAPQHYYPGTPDGSRDGIFYAHLSDMNSMPIPPLEAIAYHEGNPGHHMQISIAQELTSVPTFRTQNFQTAYVEGWALYSELLSKEMGQYKDPYSDFGRLSTELWRAIRLVVDTGLHSKGWTEEQAVQYFMENSPTAEGAIRTEIQRYMVIPGQATAYKIGMIKILELREFAMQELGEQFDIREFHDTILGNGSLPLELLEKRVNQWVSSK
ncbi:MAG: DUF885 domain-containing protein [Balneolaceae bacterium]